MGDVSRQCPMRIAPDARASRNLAGHVATTVGRFTALPQAGPVPTMRVISGRVKFLMADNSPIIFARFMRACVRERSA